METNSEPEWELWDNMPASVPMFPPKEKVRAPERVLAMLMNGKTIIAEDGKVFSVADYDELYATMFRENLMLFVNSLVEPDFYFMNECVLDTLASVACTARGDPIGIRLRKGSHARWIVQFDTWELPSEPISLILLRTLFNYIKLGVHPTPGKLGTVTMYKLWYDLKLPRHTAPGGFASQYIRDHMSGGRVDTPGLGLCYPMAVEADLTSGYLSKFLLHPTSTACPFKRGYCDDFDTWFARCNVRIDGELPLGPFPVRIYDEKDRFIEIQYPTSGTHESYLWRDQAEMCERYGCTVEPIEGYGWYQETTDNAIWAHYAYELKVQAPEEIEKLWKRCINSAIGRHGMQQKFYSLVPEYLADEVMDIPFSADRNAYSWFIHPSFDFSRPNQIHWFSQTIARCASEVFEHAFEYAADGRLIATNYDSVLFTPRGEEHIQRYPSRSNSRHLAPGTWRFEELHRVHIVAPRSLTSDEKTVLPGVDRKDRK